MNNKYFWLLLLSLFVFPLALFPLSFAITQTMSASELLDMKYGFSGKKFGTDISEFDAISNLEDKECIEFANNKKSCTKLKGDGAKLFGIPVDSISYYFYKNKFYSTNVWSEDWIDLTNVSREKRNKIEYIFIRFVNSFNCRSTGDNPFQFQVSSEAANSRYSSGVKIGEPLHESTSKCFINGEKTSAHAVLMRYHYKLGDDSKHAIYTLSLFISSKEIQEQIKLDEIMEF